MPDPVHRPVPSAARSWRALLRAASVAAAALLTVALLFACGPQGPTEAPTATWDGARWDAATWR